MSKEGRHILSDRVSNYANLILKEVSYPPKTYPFQNNEFRIMKDLKDIFSGQEYVNHIELINKLGSTREELKIVTVFRPNVKEAYIKCNFLDFLDRVLEDNVKKHLKKYLTKEDQNKIRLRKLKLKELNIGDKFYLRGGASVPYRVIDFNQYGAYVVKNNHGNYKILRGDEKVELISE